MKTLWPLCYIVWRIDDEMTIPSEGRSLPFPRPNSGVGHSTDRAWNRQLSNNFSFLGMQWKCFRFFFYWNNMAKANILDGHAVIIFLTVRWIFIVFGHFQFHMFQKNKSYYPLSLVVNLDIIMHTSGYQTFFFLLNPVFQIYPSKTYISAVTYKIRYLTIVLIRLSHFACLYDEATEQLSVVCKQTLYKALQRTWHWHLRLWPTAHVAVKTIFCRKI